MSARQEMKARRTEPFATPKLPSQKKSLPKLKEIFFKYFERNYLQPPPRARYNSIPASNLEYSALEIFNSAFS